MTKKHCAKHPFRGKSNYAGGSGEMGEGLNRLIDLRRTQNARERQTGSPWAIPHANDEARLKLIRAGRDIPAGLVIR